MKKIIKQKILDYFPYFFSTYSAFRRGYSEPEMKLIPYLCDKEKVAVDVGAFEGLYTYHLRKHSKSCYAFEPDPYSAQHLSKRFYHERNNIFVKEVALSDKKGKIELRKPVLDKGRSTVESKNKLEGEKVDIIEVNMELLDYYKLKGVGFIKIDVEGHEEAVLKGAKKTILHNAPSFIIEIEERHNPNSISRVINFFKEYDYEGFFLLDKILTPIRNFVIEKHQNPKNVVGSKRKGTYINNFIFVSSTQLNRIQSLLIEQQQK